MFQCGVLSPLKLRIGTEIRIAPASVSSDLEKSVLSHQLQIQMFADYIQIYSECASSKGADLEGRVSNCLESLLSFSKHVTKTAALCFALQSAVLCLDRW